MTSQNVEIYVVLTVISQVRFILIKPYKSINVTPIGTSTKLSKYILNKNNPQMVFQVIICYYYN